VASANILESVVFSSSPGGRRAVFAFDALYDLLVWLSDISERLSLSCLFASPFFRPEQIWVGLLSILGKADFTPPCAETWSFCYFPHNPLQLLGTNSQ